MRAYEALAGAYDALTEDVQYRKRADYLEKLMQKSRIPVHTVLDLACGTGTMTWELARRGYEMIGEDASPEMLSQAQMKTGEGIAPLFLCQSMPGLDLYGTVEAAVCCLDSLNYLTRPRDVQRTLERLRLFIAPGGVLVFDVNTDSKLRAMDGQVFIDETEDTYCVWRTVYKNGLARYDMDIFTQYDDDTWERSQESHRELIYSVEELTGWLKTAGFTSIHTYGDGVMRRPKENEKRIYFTAIRKK